MKKNDRKESDEDDIFFINATGTTLNKLAKIKAEKLLALVKQQEKEKIANGYKWVRVDKTSRLVKPSTL